MNSSSPLLAAQRQGRILAELSEKGMVRTADLAARMDVTSVTIRRDFAELQQRGLIVIVHGGARMAVGRVPPADRRQRSSVEVDAKRAIAREGAGLVHDGDVVYLDAGTTCAAMGTFLADFADLTVVTGDLSTALDLTASAPNAHLVITGGTVDVETQSTVGDLLPSMLMNFLFDVAFISASAWDERTGATTGGIAYSAAKRMVLTRANKTVLLVDASKYGATEPHVIQRLQQFDAVVSDESLPPADQAALRAAGVTLVIAD